MDGWHHRLNWHEFEWTPGVHDGQGGLACCGSVQFSSVQSPSRVRLFATRWTAARQASLSIMNSRSSLKLTSIESVMPSSYLILCCPLSLQIVEDTKIEIFTVKKVCFNNLLLIPQKDDKVRTFTYTKGSLKRLRVWVTDPFNQTQEYLRSLRVCVS